MRSGGRPDLGNALAGTAAAMNALAADWILDDEPAGAVQVGLAVGVRRQLVLRGLAGVVLEGQGRRPGE